MRKFLPILAAFLLAACQSLDKVDVTPAELKVYIDQVGATKLSFSVVSSSPDATYVHLGVGAWEDYWYPLTDQEIAQDYLKQLIAMDEDEALGTHEALFQDRFCFKGSRSFRSEFLAPDMDYRMIVFQVDPVKKTIIGNAVSAPFHTAARPAVTLSFDVQVDGDILSITPSDNGVSYYWDYESVDYFWGDTASSVYYYMYEVTDMYEQYGFIGQMLSEGPETYEFSKEDKGMVEGDTIILSASAYADHELAGDLWIWAFEYHKDPGKTNLRLVFGPEDQAQAPAQPARWQEHRSRKNR